LSRTSVSAALVQFGDVLTAALDAFLAAIEDESQNLTQPLWRKHPARDVFGIRLSNFSIGSSDPCSRSRPAGAFMEQV